MSMDWLATLGAQDQSLEALLARRDLSKQIQQAMQVSQEAENRRQFDENQDRQREALREQIALRKAQQAETFRRTNEAKEDRDRTEKRNRYNTVVDNLRGQVTAGVTPHIDPETAALIREFEGPGSVSDANAKPADFVGPQDPEAAKDFVYLRQQAEAAALKAKHEQERQDAQTKRQAEADARDAKRLDNENARLKMAQDKEDRAKQAAAEKKKTADAMLNNLPPGHPLRAGIKPRAEQILKEQSSFLDALDPWAKQESIMDAYVQATKEAIDQYHQMNPAAAASAPVPHVVGGRGAGPGAGPAPGATAGGGEWTDLGNGVRVRKVPGGG